MIRRLVISDKDTEWLSTASWDTASQQDDFFDYSKVVIQKPWGYEYLLCRTPDVAVWVLHIRHGFKTSFHCHPNKKTSLAILSGVAECTTLNEAHTLGPGDGFLIEKGVFHSTAALSSKGITVIETETPANKKDLIRAFDSYGRAGQGYENSSCYTDLDGSLHCHFHADPYGPSRKIGEFELAVTKDAILPTADIIAILRGGIYQAGVLAYGVGDVMNTQDIGRGGAYSIVQDSEFLTIKRL
jgi:mannose-6-phosphate isomerase-like protein (cupin superfamily)